MNAQRHVFALVGPTAVGKTDVSIELARRLQAEIVGCDSMQVYRRMPHLTTQPTPEQQAAVPHHLMSCVEPTDSFSVGQYRTAALAAIADIQQREQSVLLVGGTGLYLKALLRGFSEVPAADERIRAELAAAIRAQGTAAFHTRLQTVDAAAASKIHPNDARRIVRALEVYELTGKPLSSFWHWEQGPALPMTVMGLTCERPHLHARINRRVEHMIRDERVLQEAREALRMPLSRTAGQVHGLCYLETYLAGTATREQTMILWQQQVRQYARRQLIWFRAQPEIQWLTLGAEEHPAATAQRIVEQMSR